MIEFFLALLAVAGSLASNSDPSQAASICAAPQSDDTLVAHESCHMFYECSKGRPIPINCPNNLLYNPEKEYCDWPENVDCSGREVRGGSYQVNVNEVRPQRDNIASNVVNYNIPNTRGVVRGNTDPIEAASICAQPNSDSVLVAHEDCNKFYKCYKGVPVAIFCPHGLLYNPNVQVCDWPQNVDCDGRNTGILQGWFNEY